MSKAKVGFHIHTTASDGLYTPRRVMSEAAKMGFDYIAVTDHNEISGSLAASRLEKKYGVKVIPGIEIAFITGGRITELLVYFKSNEQLKSFLTEFLKPNPIMPFYKKAEEVLAIIEKNEGVFVPPHPLNNKGVVRNKLNIKLTAFESVNAANNPEINKKAIRYQKENGLVGLAGSDLHSSFFLLNTYTLVESNGEITTKNILDAIAGGNSKVKFEIVDGGQKESLLSPIVRISRTLLHAKFILFTFVKRVILRHNY